MRILVLGGDGYLGWPTALHLSAAGHQVGVADNFVRRQYDVELGVDSLVPIQPLDARVARWQELSGFKLGQYVGDLCDGGFRARHGAGLRPRHRSSTSRSRAPLRIR